MRWQFPRQDKLKRTRVAFINTHPIQHFIPHHLTPTSTESRTFRLRHSAFPITGCVGATDHGFGRVIKMGCRSAPGYEARFLRGAKRRGEPLASSLSRAATMARGESGHIRCTSRAWACARCQAGAAAKMTRIRTFLRCEMPLGMRKSSQDGRSTVSYRSTRRTENFTGRLASQIGVSSPVHSRQPALHDGGASRGW
jgi:hypothetical protein